MSGGPVRRATPPAPGPDGLCAVVREASRGDLASVVALAADGHADAPAPEAAVRAWAVRLQQPAQRLYVLELAPSAGEAQGAAGYVVAAAHIAVVVEEAEVIDVWVGRSHRNRGHATQLLCGALDTLFALGVRHVVLEVRRGNAPATALYSKLGLTQVGVRPGYYVGLGPGATTAASDALLLRGKLPLRSCSKQ